MCKPEVIFLQAKLIQKIDEAVFLATLENGHQVIAYARGFDKSWLSKCQLGDVVRLKMSPFDMSKGCLSRD